MKAYPGIKGTPIRPAFSSNKAVNDDDDDKHESHSDRRMLTCSYAQFVKLWLPQWYSAEDIERMIEGLNYVDVKRIRHQDLPT